jgi:hypothetical protein
MPAVRKVDGINWIEVEPGKKVGFPEKVNQEEIFYPDPDHPEEGYVVWTCGCVFASAGRDNFTGSVGGSGYSEGGSAGGAGGGRRADPGASTSDAAGQRNRIGCDVVMLLRRGSPADLAGRARMGKDHHPRAKEPTPPLVVEHPAPKDGEPDQRPLWPGTSRFSCYGQCDRGTSKECVVKIHNDNLKEGSGTVEVTCECE